MNIRIDHLLSQLIGHVDDVKDRYHMGKVMLKTLKVFENRIHQIDYATGRSETNGSVMDRSIRCAIWMRKQGIKQGDVIAIAGVNHLDNTIPFIAALYLGVAIQPIDVLLNHVDFQRLFAIGEPKIFFCDTSRILDIAENALSKNELKTKIVTFGKREGRNYTVFDDILKAPDCEVEEFVANDFDPETTTCLIMATSGTTTGTPKCVQLPQRTCMVNISEGLWIPDDFQTRKMVILSASSMQWYSAEIALFSCCFFGATRIQTSKPFTPEMAFEIINKHKPTHMIMLPVSALNLLNHKGQVDWSSFKTVAVVGSEINMELLINLQKTVFNAEIMPCYSLTEICCVITCGIAPKNLDPNSKVSIGKLTSLLKAKIVDDNGKELGPNEPGEICIKTDYKFTGYYKNEEATKEALTEDGWFKTGDFAYIDEDGNFYFAGRKKLMMKYKGYALTPSEFESVIQTHPAVQLVVVGKRVVYPEDLPVAIIVRKPGATVTADDIKKLVRDSLADYKQLYGGVAFVDSLPFLPSGKVDRFAVSKMISNIRTE